MPFRSSRLRCSFCGRGEADVEKLVAGPRVYICDRCAAIAMQIINSASGEAPPPRRGAPSPLRRLLSWATGRRPAAHRRRWLDMSAAAGVRRWTRP